MKSVSTKILSIIAAVIGCLCVAFAIWTVYTEVHIAAVIPGIDPGTFDQRYLWWPIYAAVVLWTLACFGFILHRKHRRNHAA
jgi:TRAP-type C4-dicarboxylate transport system permease small subunit